VAAAVAAPVVAKAPKPAAVKPATDKRRGKKSRQPTAEVDVELMPPDAPQKERGLVHWVSQLSRRDFIAFGLGAGSVLLAIFLGWIVAKLAGH